MDRDPLAAFNRGVEYTVPLTTPSDQHVPDRVNRLRSLGNAIVPQVAYLFLSAMMEAEREDR